MTKITTRPSWTWTRIKPDIAKLAFRPLLPLFAEWWKEARDTAIPGSLDAAIWPNYFRMLRDCQEVLYHAPLHPDEARTVQVQRRHDRPLEQLTTTLAALFPNGFMEFEAYVVAEKTHEWRRQHRLTRYRQVKSRKRYRKERRRR